MADNKPELKIVEKPEIPTEELKFKVNEDVLTDIIGRLHKDKIIKKPQMRFLYNDRGILETLYNSHMKEEQISIMRQTQPDTFLMIMAVHSMGAGMVTIFKQKEKGKKLSQFTDEEVFELNNLFKAYDAYQMACEYVEAKPGSQKKKYLDLVASQGVFIARRTAGDKLMDEEVLQSFAQTMFTLGITIALG